MQTFVRVFGQETTKKTPESNKKVSRDKCFIKKSTLSVEDLLDQVIEQLERSEGSWLECLCGKVEVNKRGGEGKRNMKDF